MLLYEKRSEHLSLFSVCPEKLNTAGTDCVPNCDSSGDNPDKDNDGQCDKCPIKLSIDGTACVSLCEIPDADNDGQCGCPNGKVVSSICNNGTSCVETCTCDGEKLLSYDSKQCVLCTLDSEFYEGEDLFDFDEDGQCGCQSELDGKFVNADNNGCVTSCGEDEEEDNGKCYKCRKNVLD